MVFIAQLATAGGVRAPLAKIADQIFLDLTRELSAQGLKKKVIADNGPLSSLELAERTGLQTESVERALRELEASRRVVHDGVNGRYASKHSKCRSGPSMAGKPLFSITTRHWSAPSA